MFYDLLKFTCNMSFFSLQRHFCSCLTRDKCIVNLVPKYATSFQIERIFYLIRLTFKKDACNNLKLSTSLNACLSDIIITTVNMEPLFYEMYLRKPIFYSLHYKLQKQKIKITMGNSDNIWTGFLKIIISCLHFLYLCTVTYKETFSLSPAD